MSKADGFAVTRHQSDDRFYNPPAVRRHHQQLLLQEQQQQHRLRSQVRRPLLKECRADSAEAESWKDTESDESTLSRPNSVCSVSPRRNSNLTNLDRLMESVTPFMPARYFSEVRMREWRSHQPEMHPFFCLGDLWESFREWSVYGLGVPLLLNGSDSVKQYYVPFLSGIQIYIDQQRLRTGDDSDVESSRETSSGESSDCEAEGRVKGSAVGVCGHQNLLKVNSQRINTLTLGDKPLVSSYNDESEVCNSSRQLIYEYLEQEQPRHRKPLYDKVSSLASEFPDIQMCRSCDLLPASWVSVAWYPIYRIPMGPTLQNLDASFLTFHSLSTHCRSRNLPQLRGLCSKKVSGLDTFSKISLPVFGLASYKLRGSILSPSGVHEWQQENSLFQAADNWLRCLQVNLPDFEYFVSHNSQWR